jgi:hypothetical protein
LKYLTNLLFDASPKNAGFISLSKTLSYVTQQIAQWPVDQQDAFWIWLET